MTCTEISRGTVEVVLDYLCPLSGPVPPHLLSRPLLQRHHFLALSPENAAEYLAWPSSEQSHAVHLLQSDPIPPHDHPLQVNYSADTENLLAHVRITPDLRLVFLWDNNSGWQYHNVALMPFPANSYPTFDRAYAAYAPDDFLPEPSYNVSVTDEDDDSYWNAYGGGDDSEHPSISDDALAANPNSEDAYWAQYSTVQGSGDSTLPSPHPEKKKFAGAADTDNTAPARIIVPSDDFQIYHGEPYNPLEPPEPSALARRLEALSASSGSRSPPLFDDSPTTDTDSISASPQGIDGMTASSSSGSCQLRTDELVPVDSVITSTMRPKRFAG
ncbi:hypothetical protein BDZ97DRAFT_1912399 [Flammula alnicola]|nr:hypothetical protein BDZ97DRAFT_1912399 [Flammula alnicola]